MSFAWTNLSKSTMEELARAAGLRVTRAQADLTERYGAIPDERLIEELWPVLREGWVRREPVARRMIVEGMRGGGLGDLSIKVRDRPGQMAYLKSCRMSATLKRVVLEALHKVGSLPWDMPAADHAKPAEEVEFSYSELLRRACDSLTERSIAGLELGVCLAAGRVLRGIPVPTPEADRAEVAARVVAAVFEAAPVHAARELPIELPDSEHRKWVLSGAALLSADKTRREQTVMTYAREVEEILTDGVPDAFNAAMTCTSMFFTAMAFGPDLRVTLDQSRDLVVGLSWILQVLEPSGTDAPTELRRRGVVSAPETHPTSEVAVDDSAGEEDGADEVEDVTWDPSAQSLKEFLDEHIQRVDGATGPFVNNDGDPHWVVPHGSTICGVTLHRHEEASPVLEYRAPLVIDVSPSPELFEFVNTVNVEEPLVRAAVQQNFVDLRYAHFVGAITSLQLFQSLGHFLHSADHYDDLVRDRFGGHLVGSED